MLLLNPCLTLSSPFESRMMSVAFFAVQTLLLACCMALLANALGAHSQYGLDLQLAPADTPPNPNRLHHQGCNVSFTKAAVFLIPEEELGWAEYACLADSILRGLFYQISCVLLTAALLIVFGVFLVMSMFVMDLAYLFGRAVAGAGITKE